MSYSQSKKNSKEEKRFQSITTQLYGKQNVLVTSPKVKDESNNAITSDSSASSNVHSGQDLHYLKKDLIRIGILTFGAIAFQIVLYLSLKSNFLNFLNR